MFLSFEGLVQAFGIAPSRHHASGEFINDDHLIILDDIVLVALEKLVGAQRLLHVMDDGDVLGIVKIVALEQARSTQNLLEMFVALLGQGAGTLLFIELVIIRRQLRNILIQGIIEIRLVIKGAGNNQGCSGFINED